jgi:crotonobetainyl-CoA:carnitine CoA-transferase CaiB-like acyl-CoA transferase
MNIQEIQDMWDSDSELDSSKLGDESLKTPKLHAKYVRILIDSKMKLIKLKTDYSVMRQLKFRYYRGELTRQELQDNNLEQWGYAKPIKSEMDEHLKGDKDLAQIEARIEYMNIMVGLVESIMNAIKSRQWDIRNSIDHMKFMAGG